MKPRPKIIIHPSGIAEAYYKKLPARIVRRARRILDKELRAIVDEFSARNGF